MKEKKKTYKRKEKANNLRRSSSKVLFIDYYSNTYIHINIYRNMYKVHTYFYT